MHKAGIYHRDLKPENIVFVWDNYNIKIIDFGLFKKFVDEENQNIKLEWNTHYCPPEIIKENPYNGREFDIFFLRSNVICFEG